VNRAAALPRPFLAAACPPPRVQAFPGWWGDGATTTTHFQRGFHSYEKQQYSIELLYRFRVATSMAWHGMAGRGLTVALIKFIPFPHAPQWATAYPESGIGVVTACGGHAIVDRISHG